MLTLEKSRPTDRHRGGVAFIETHTGAFYGRLGYLAGIGRSSSQIAEELGVSSGYVTKTLSDWGIRRPKAYCQVPLTHLQRCTLVWRAEKAGQTPEEWLEQLVASAIRDGLPASVGRQVRPLDAKSSQRPIWRPLYVGWGGHKAREWGLS